MEEARKGRFRSSAPVIPGVAADLDVEKPTPKLGAAD
jgi:hypothetical protein